jgi:hypothetical protein
MLLVNAVSYLFVIASLDDDCQVTEKERRYTIFREMKEGLDYTLLRNHKSIILLLGCRFHGASYQVLIPYCKGGIACDSIIRVPDGRGGAGALLGQSF